MFDTQTAPPDDVVVQGDASAHPRFGAVEIDVRALPVPGLLCVGQAKGPPPPGCAGAAENPPCRHLGCAGDPSAEPPGPLDSRPFYFGQSGELAGHGRAGGRIAPEPAEHGLAQAVVVMQSAAAPPGGESSTTVT